MRKIEEQSIRKLYKHNQSYAMTLPISVIRKLGWRERQKLTVTRKGESIIISDWKE